MKKLVALLCMLACIFSLTGCGTTEEALSESTKQNMTNAATVTTEFYIPFMENMYALDKGVEFLGEYNRHEVEAIFETQSGMYVDGNSFISGVSSFMAEYENVGTVMSMGEPVVEANDGEIVVSVEIVGSNKTGTAEFIYTDDIFLKLESCVLNTGATLSESMMKATMNTLLGMGTVFVVLILIIFVIQAFALIPKIQAAFAKKEEPKAKEDAVDNTIAQIIEKEELSDDTELVAVIAAAIAAYEGNATTDGFVVRSIRKSRRR